MSVDYDIVIRNGLVFDGAGSAAFEADVAIRGDRIAAVGAISARGREELDAKGKIVTPGFVDPHTHYDGQATWDQEFSPSSNHGVTTVVMGNCGVGFAPCKPEQRDSLLKLMEGVEDIPEIVMAEGVPWSWRSYPEYLAFLAAREGDLDFAAMVPHGPVRLFVMGERAAERARANDEDIAEMARIVREALAAGAVGFSTTRTLFHRTSSGDYSPTYDAAEDELEALVGEVKASPHGVFQLVCDFDSDLGCAERDFGLIERLARLCGRPTLFTLADVPGKPTVYRHVLDLVTQANGRGARIMPEIFDRPPGQLLGLDLSAHPFSSCPSFQPLESLSLDRKVEAMRDPSLRARLLSETPVNAEYFRVARVRLVEQMFELGDPPNYEPSPEERIGVRAQKTGVDPLAFAYDLLLKNQGQGIIYNPLSNFEGLSFDALLTQMKHPDTLICLGDGGAHYGSICDASYSTYLLTHWTRDRVAGERFPLEWAIHSLTQRPAHTFGMRDRGLIAAGLKADLNVIDYDRLRLGPPYPRYDLPAGGRRLYQEATGYDATLVSGVITRRDSAPTGALPGRLQRGNRFTQP